MILGITNPCATGHTQSQLDMDRHMDQLVRLLLRKFIKFAIESRADVVPSSQMPRTSRLMSGSWANIRDQMSSHSSSSSDVLLMLDWTLPLLGWT